MSLFGVNFDFSKNPWLIWLGLSIWFVYTTFRVNSYYISYVKGNLQKKKNRFIYWEDEGSEYWRNILNNHISNLEVKKIGILDDERNHKYRILYDNSNDGIDKLVDNGKIPGIVNLKFKKIDENDIQQSICERLPFEIDDKHTDYFQKRKRKYLLTDDWWEFTFILIFFFIILGTLVIGWGRIIF